MAELDLVISDDEYADLKNAHMLFGETAETTIDSYRKIMDDVSISAIYSGAVADNLRLFLLQADRLNDRLSDLGTRIAVTLQSYVDAIDAADADIYNAY